MRRLSTPFLRACLLACAWCLLCAGSVRAATAQYEITVDLDGDGARDTVSVARDNPANLHVWLSSTGSVDILRSHHPIVQVIAVDLDGDRRLELVTHDTGARLHVWTGAGTGYRRLRAGPRFNILRAPLLATPPHDAGDMASAALPETKRLSKVATAARRTTAAPAARPWSIAVPAVSFHASRFVTPAAQRPPPAFPL